MSWQTSTINPAVTSPAVDINKITNDLQVLRDTFAGNTDPDVPVSASALGAVTLTGDQTIAGNKTFTGNTSYTGTLTGGTGVINIGSGQLFKDANGNVGIGTSSPGSRFVVQQTTDTTLGGIAITSVDGNGAAISRLNDGGLTFRNGGFERARIDSSGNLLVGTTTAVTTNVAGVMFAKVGTQGRMTIGSASTSAQDIAYFFNPNGIVGSIQTSGSSTSYVTSSDYRLKHDIQPMTGALAKVLQLKPVTYKWNADDSQSQGFIAHELAEVVPDAVTGEKDAVDAEGKPQYQGIDTSFLVATLTAAIQEQQTMIEQLKADVAALKESV